MKEQDMTRLMLESRIKFYRTITYSLICLAAVCICTLAGTFYFPSHPEKEVTTLFISLTSGLFGSLVTIVVQSIQQAKKLQSEEDLQEAAMGNHAVLKEETQTPPT